MIADFLRWLFKTESSVVKSFEEILLSLGFLNILAAVIGVLHFFNPYVIVKTVKKVYAKQ